MFSFLFFYFLENTEKTCILDKFYTVSSSPCNYIYGVLVTFQLINNYRKINTGNASSLIYTPHAFILFFNPYCVSYKLSFCFLL